MARGGDRPDQNGEPACRHRRGRPCELLEWDSEHFGFPIGQVVGDTLTPGAADAIDDWCFDQGIGCLYFLADAEDDESPGRGQPRLPDG